MQIHLENIGRRFNREWIFKDIHFLFEAGNRYALLGPNGSGKSTLLQILAASLSPSSGKIKHINKGMLISSEDMYSYFSIAAPYMDLIEEFTLRELIDFQFSVKPAFPDLDADKLIRLLGMENAQNRLIRNFSSGMKQRVKLALAVATDAACLFLDEPTANMDAQGIEWYKGLIDEFLGNRLLIVCSNQPHEYEMCSEILNILDYK